ncbi:MAG TPA: CHAT domain-containing tetratricopeptide repeat protein [Bryobacteraceae bacterium]|nr:CHAT domain-containing tetratricopeptide repeat protein [Bryobacteraceae bacterium]
MKTRFLVSLLSIIPLAGTLVRSVPPPRTPNLARPSWKIVRRDKLTEQFQQSYKIFRAGGFQDAAALARQGYGDASRAGEPQLAAQFLLGLGNCQFAVHQYRQALQTYLDARQRAEASGDNAIAGKADWNIASLYSHLGQLDAASEAIGRAMARLTGPERLAQLPRLLTYLAALQADQGRMPQALDLYRQGIAAASRAGDQEMYADAWNDLGYEYLEHEQLPQAERALIEAYSVRKLGRMRSIESCYRNLGMLRLEQGDPRSAAVLLDRAVALSKEPGGLRPIWEVYYARGRVRLKQNRLQDALDDLRIAAPLAHNWRREAFPDDATRVSTENKIQKVHSALVEAGNRLYFATHRRALAQETFESAEANRAASLRVLLAEPRDWRRNLPDKYWETLQQLESAEAASLRSPGSPSGPAEERVRQLQGALIQWESRAGSNTDVQLPNLLERTRRSLGPDAAFLAFHLASPNSYLWAVSRDRFALYRLPPEPEIAALVAGFTKAVSQGSGQAQAAGARIFRVLFGQLDPAIRRKPRWLLALDAQLFQLPFAALVEEAGTAGPVFLAERHSLQITSGAGMLSPASLNRQSCDGPFVGVADAVYNTADARWKGSQPASFFHLLTARADSTSDLHLARLAGSAREVDACARAWSGSRTPILLEGVAACRERLQAALNGHPAVLHFATHVVHSSVPAGGGGQSDLIVLSLTQSGQPEVLSPAEIATWHLDGALVSLSGCSSGSADAFPATGLMGLTRACQAAGASAVVASRWPTPDDAGTLFLSFYGYLRAAPQDGPAVALQRAQIGMLRSRTWRSNPLYWGAYFVTGNQQ